MLKMFQIRFGRQRSFRDIRILDFLPSGGFLLFVYITSKAMCPLITKDVAVLSKIGIMVILLGITSFWTRHPLLFCRELPVHG
jgi:hypothetical protein